MNLKKLFREHGVNIPETISEEELQKAVLAEIAEKEKEKNEAIFLAKKKELAVLQSAMERLTNIIRQDLEKRDLLNGTKITFVAEFGQYGLKVVSKGNSVLTNQDYYVHSDGTFSKFEKKSNLPYDFRQARKLA